MSFTIALTTKSGVKVGAIEKFLGLCLPHFNIMKCPTVDLPTAEQPINSAKKCADTRLGNIRKHYPQIPTDALRISIENGMVIDGTEWVYDVAYVTIELPDGRHIYGQSTRGKHGEKNNYWARVPFAWYRESLARMQKENPEYEHSDDGLDITLGKSHIGPYLKTSAPDAGFTHDNWHGYPEFGGFDRKDQIMDALLNAFSLLLKDHVRLTNGFPKLGVTFQDQNGIMANPLLHQLMICTIVGKIRHSMEFAPTKIVGLDARGFLYGPIVAQHLKCGFVMARKAGKQPPTLDLVRVVYGTEYSQDSIELERSMLKWDDRVLIWDDLVATGGSLDAAFEAIYSCGVKQVASACALRVDGLFEEACQKLPQSPLIILG